MSVVIASWIVTIDPALRRPAREDIARIPGARLHPTADPLVLTTECGAGDLGRVHQAIAGVSGVLTVAMVTAYTDREVEDT